MEEYNLSEEQVNRQALIDNANRSLLWVGAAIGVFIQRLCVLRGLPKETNVGIGIGCIALGAWMRARGERYRNRLGTWTRYTDEIYAERRDIIKNAPDFCKLDVLAEVTQLNNYEYLYYPIIRRLQLLGTCLRYCGALLEGLGVSLIALELGGIERATCESSPQ